MAQPPQFRPGGPGGPPPPMGPPGAQVAPGFPRQSTLPAMIPGMPPSFPPIPMGSMEVPLAMSGDNGKKRKKGKKRTDDSDDEEEECKCAPPQPSTQIFICPPGCQSPGGMGMMGGGQGGFGQQRYSGQGNEGFPFQGQTQDLIDPAKLCQIQCYGGSKSEDKQTQVICCPPSSCVGCQKKGQQRQKSPVCVCQGCGQECPSRRKKKAKDSPLEGMMPASQQFLMFLQAYGLAAALIRDRNRREDERQQKEIEKMKEKKDSDGAKEKDKGKDKGKKKK